jgi:hypothetical protein
MDIPLADYAIEYRSGAIRVYPSVFDPQALPARALLSIMVVNVGHVDNRVRAFVHHGNALVADSADLGGEAEPFDLVKPGHLGFFRPDDLDTGTYAITILAASLNLVPSIDVAVLENVDGQNVTTFRGRCLPGDFAVFHHRVRVLPGVEGTGTIVSASQ